MVLESSLADAARPAPEVLRRNVELLLAALRHHDFEGLEALCSHRVTLWSTQRDRLGSLVGRGPVVMALQRLSARARPEHTRVLRSGDGTAMLCAYAGGRALWTLEVAYEDELVDAVMVWLSPSSAVTPALVLEEAPAAATQGPAGAR